jgi:hypothetical protein
LVFIAGGGNQWNKSLLSPGIASAKAEPMKFGLRQWHANLGRFCNCGVNTFAAGNFGVNNY